jgi:hypothetical protein
MSYVRWSSDGFRSDVYAYADAGGGFTLHIAGRRRLGLDELGPNPMEELGSPTFDAAAVSKRYRVWMDALTVLPFEDIDHPDASETFNFATLAELRDKLAAYQAEGKIHVPKGVVEGINDELAEGS